MVLINDIMIRGTPFERIEKLAWQHVQRDLYAILFWDVLQIHAKGNHVLPSSISLYKYIKNEVRRQTENSDE